MPDLGAARDRARADAEIAAMRQKNQLRRLYAVGMFAVVIIQLVVANVVFIAYLRGTGRPKGQAVDSTAMDVYLGSTVVQVIGIVLVITKYLFPEGSKL